MESGMEKPGLTQVHGNDTDALREPLIETRLLSASGDEYKSGIYQVEPSDDVKVTARVVWQEVKKLCWIAGPMIAVNLLQYCLSMISVIMVGHLGELALSSASMATSFTNVTGLHVLMGMAGALETLCGQAYGAKQYHLLGIQLQRGIFVLFCVSIPLAVLWAYMGHLLVALDQDPLISFEAGKFARWLIPSLFASAVFQPLVKFLQSQGVVLPMMLSSSITLCFHVPVCWALVFKVGLGNKGAALANSISNWLNVAILSLYVIFSPACKTTWTSFSREALYDITHFLKLAIPSAVMLCLEFWSFEILVLLSGLLPKPELEMSILSICLSTVALAYMIPFGLGAAISTRVSNELGAGRSRTAQLSVCVGVCMAAMEALMIGSILLAVRNVWGYVYSNEVEVIDYISGMMPLLAPSTLLDAIQGVLSGIARGCGWQELGAYANLGAYYVVGIPVAVILAFVLHVGARGLWAGAICGLFTQTILLSIITFCTNWEEQAKKASARVYTSALPTVTDNIIKASSLHPTSHQLFNIPCSYHCIYDVEAWSMIRQLCLVLEFLSALLAGEVSHYAPLFLDARCCCQDFASSKLDSTTRVSSHKGLLRAEDAMAGIGGIVSQVQQGPGVAGAGMSCTKFSTEGFAILASALSSTGYQGLFVYVLESPEEDLSSLCGTSRCTINWP